MNIILKVKLALANSVETLHKKCLAYRFGQFCDSVFRKSNGDGTRIL